MPILNPAYVNALLQMINASPYPSFLPFKVQEITWDETIVTMSLSERHLQPLGTAHGGVIATLIDTAAYWPGFIKISPKDGMVSVDLKLNYLKPATTGLLTATGRCIHAGRTLSYGEAFIRDEADKIVAHGTSTLMTIPGQGFGISIPKFVKE